MTERTAQLIGRHCQEYPQLQILDIFKFLFQSSFGCEHLVGSQETAAQRIREEYAALAPDDLWKIDPLDGAYARVHLSCMAKGLTPETLAKLFCLSAIKEDGGKAALTEKLRVAKELASTGMIPFSADDLQKKSAEWEAEGFPAVRHSPAFREAYHPAYRVIAQKYIPFLPLLAEIDKQLAQGPLKLAIEGGSASGKTTLSRLLEDIYGCTVFHMDDFFLRPEQRTPERLAEPGGNVDRERFLSEVLIPLSKGETVRYHPFDCGTMGLKDAVTAEPKSLTVIEGAYSMHPSLREHYGLSVYLEITPETQRERILRRNGPQLASRFFREWIPMEQRYFAAFRIPEHCDLQVNISE